MYLTYWGAFIKILLAGDRKLCPFFYLLLSNNKHEPYLLHDVKKEHPAESTNSTTPHTEDHKTEEISQDYKIAKSNERFDYAVIFIKSDLMTAEDDIREINNNYKGSTPILAIIEKDRFDIIDLLFNLNIREIFYNFVPESILDYINFLQEELMKKEDAADLKKSQNYVIDFYENKDVFVIDISGPIQLEKVSGLKLMFMNYLKDRIKKLRGVIYIFSDVNEKALNFRNIWALLRIWYELGINYKNIVYLSNSDKLQQIIGKFFARYGMQLYPNLLEIVRYLYPELAQKNEMELFDFSSQILLSQRKATGPGK